MGTNTTANENMYRVGDHVYFETVTSAPYQIRKIEELSQSPNGCVEARVTMYFRRKDLTPSLLMVLDKEQSFLEEQREALLNEEGEEKQKHDSTEESETHSEDKGTAQVARKLIRLGELALAVQEHIKLCEIFPSSNQEVLQATHIRGKCQVIPLEEEVESRLDFASKENAFYFTRKFDPEKKTLKPPGNRIRVGGKWQAEVQPFSPPSSTNSPDAELRVYETPTFFGHCLPVEQVDDFLTMASAVGLYARAQNVSSATRDSCLLTSAALAHRAVTKFKALSLLHEHNYDMSSALLALVSGGRPLLCRDELEDWSPNEAYIFAQALEKNGKAFSFMKRTLFTWKDVSDIVAYYYMWKTTDRYAYLCQKQALSKTDTKLKQVFIPQYSRVNPAVLYRKTEEDKKPCFVCSATESSHWYAWNANPAAVVAAEEPSKFCRDCWYYWKKYGSPKTVDRPTVNGVPKDANLVPIGGRDKDEVVSSRASKENKVLSASDVLPVGVSSYPCCYPGCKLVFRTKSSMERHLQMVHPEFVPPTSCDGVKVYENGHSGDTPLRSANTSTQANLPFSSFLRPVERLGRRLLLEKRRSHKLARRPFSDTDWSGLTYDAILLKGTESMSSTPLPTVSYHVVPQSAKRICERLMKNLGLQPQDRDAIFGASSSQPPSVQKLPHHSTAPLTPSPSPSTSTSIPPAVKRAHSPFLSNGTSRQEETSDENSTVSPTVKRSRLMVVDELTSPRGSTEIEQY